MPNLISLLPRHFICTSSSMRMKMKLIFPIQFVHIFSVSVNGTTSHPTAQTNSHLWLYISLTKFTVVNSNSVSSLLSHLFPFIMSKPKCPSYAFSVFCLTPTRFSLSTCFQSFLPLDSFLHIVTKVNNLQ